MYKTFTRNKHLVATICLAGSLAFSGCKQTAPGVRNSDGSITNADGSVTYPPGTAPAPQTATPTPTPRLNADGSTTNPDGSVTYPAGSTRASRLQSAPQRSEQRNEDRRDQRQDQRPEDQRAGMQPGNQYGQQPAPVDRREPAPVARVIPAGTAVQVSPSQTLSASRNEVGDSFSGVLAAPIVVDSASFFERGTPVTGSVVASKRKGRFKGAGDLGIEINSIGGIRVSSSEFEAASKGQGRRTGEIIGGTGAVGALIGGLAGGGKGALIGGLAGAGAGTAGAAYTGNRDVVIPAETPISFQLTAPVTLHR